MMTKTISLETRNWAIGPMRATPLSGILTCTLAIISLTKQVALEIELLAWDTAKQTYVIRVRTVEVLSVNDPGFKANLLYNLLQKNIGNVDIYPADAGGEDYLATLNGSWEILPPGEREANLAIIIGWGRSISPETCAKLIERYTFLERMRPRNFIAGTSGFRRYFGAQYADKRVVFEQVAIDPQKG
jgi:hypothetical protein